MPDIASLLFRRWKVVAALTLGAALLALILSLLSPRQYLGTATALAANSALSDRARIFNPNIEGLYSELGSPDELDKIEGTAKLDTIYLAAAGDYHLAGHYGLDTTEKNALAKAARQLKKHTAISRTGYGELKVKVWDKSNTMAADLANALLKKLNDIHQHLQTENNRLVLQRLKEEWHLRMQALGSANNAGRDTTGRRTGANSPIETAVATSQVRQYGQLIDEYQLALKTAPNVLLVVEPARPSPWADKPETVQNVLFAFLAALLFSVLLLLYLESRNSKE